MSSFIPTIKRWIIWQWNYWSKGVWEDNRNNWRVKFIKTVSLTVRTFFNADMQSRACSMTYQMILAVVPTLALLVAIGRGFGLQGIIESELYKMFPAQKTAVSYAMNFVDSYLTASTEGVFVGVGLLFLLYTLISLFISIEDNFNFIWGVKEGRSFGRKIIDYTAMLLILPVVLVCSGGLSIVLTSSIQSAFNIPEMSLMMEWLLEALSWLLTIIFFSLLYMLMPNTKVNFYNAFVAGIFAAVGFLALQWLFITGQIYVSKYNAIYGSFSFLPLMLLWMQFTWIIIFIGGIICYSSQNLSQFSYFDKIRNISRSYQDKVLLAVCAVIVQRFVKGYGATRSLILAKDYSLPPRLVSMACDNLTQAGILSVVEINSKREIKGYQPAIDPSTITVKEVFYRLDKIGSSKFLKDFSTTFPGIVNIYNKLKEAENEISENTLVENIEIQLKS